MNNLEKALSRLVEDNEFAAPLARILLSASTRGIVSHSEVEGMVSDNLEEVLLLGNNWRLLIPVRIVKSGAWEDRLLLCRPGESYELPNIVRHLVQNASRTGCWDLVYAINEAFKETEEPAWQQMPQLIEQLGKQARGYCISAADIKQICIRAGLGDRVDTLIAELKSSGVMSPKLSSLAEVSRAGSPLYELNPSLFIKEGEKNDRTGAETHGRNT